MAKSSSPLDKIDSKGREKVDCKLCGGWYHRLDVHLKKKHNTSVDPYTKQFPGAPTISPAAKEAASKGASRKDNKAKAVKEAKTLAAPVDGTFRIGVAQIEMRKDLPVADSVHVPDHDPYFAIGRVEKDRWEYLALGIQTGENVLIVGPTGCGKSAAVGQLASACNQPLRRINLHGEVRVSDFVGDKTVEVDPETNQAVVTWQDGILPDAMRHGHWLLLDELDAAPAHVLFVLQAVLEKGMRLVLSANGGEVVKAHPNFRLIATANTLGRGDDSGLYAGTNVLNEAFLDRFGIVIRSSYPATNTERDILVDRSGIGALDAQTMVKIAHDVRRALEMETVYCTFSTRRLITWAMAAVRLGDVKKALGIAVTNRLSDQDAKFITGLVNRYWR